MSEQMKNTLEMLQQLDDGVQKRYNALEELQRTPVRQGFLNEGQGVGDFFKRSEDPSNRPTGTQNRAMMAMAQGIDNRDRGKGGIGGISAGYGRGLDLMDEMRARQKDTNLKTGAIGLRGATDKRDHMMDMLKMLPEEATTDTSWQTVGGDRILVNDTTGEEIHNAGPVSGPEAAAGSSPSDINKAMTETDTFKTYATQKTQAARALDLLDNAGDTEQSGALIERVVSEIYNGDTRAASEIDRFTASKGITTSISDWVKKVSVGKLSPTTKANLRELAVIAQRAARRAQYDEITRRAEFEGVEPEKYYKLNGLDPAGYPVEDKVPAREAVKEPDPTGYNWTPDSGLVDSLGNPV